MSEDSDEDRNLTASKDTVSALDQQRNICRSTSTAADGCKQDKCINIGTEVKVDRRTYNTYITNVHYCSTRHAVTEGPYTLADMKFQLDNGAVYTQDQGISAYKSNSTGLKEEIDDTVSDSLGFLTEHTEQKAFISDDAVYKAWTLADASVTDEASKAISDDELFNIIAQHALSLNITLREQNSSTQLAAFKDNSNDKIKSFHQDVSNNPNLDSYTKVYQPSHSSQGAQFNEELQVYEVDLRQIPTKNIRLVTQHCVEKVVCIGERNVPDDVYAITKFVDKIVHEINTTKQDDDLHSVARSSKSCTYQQELFLPENLALQATTITIDLSEISNAYVRMKTRHNIEVIVRIGENGEKVFCVSSFLDNAMRTQSATF